MWFSQPSYSWAHSFLAISSTSAFITITSATLNIFEIRRIDMTSANVNSWIQRIACASWGSIRDQTIEVTSHTAYSFVNLNNTKMLIGFDKSNGSLIQKKLKSTTNWSQNYIDSMILSSNKIYMTFLCTK